MPTVKRKGDKMFQLQHTNYRISIFKKLKKIFFSFLHTQHRARTHDSELLKTSWSEVIIPQFGLLHERDTNLYAVYCAIFVKAGKYKS